MQCKPVADPSAGEKWTFEIKFDGYRCIAVKRGREVTLFSRHKKVLNKRMPISRAIISAISRRCCSNKDATGPKALTRPATPSACQTGWAARA